MPEQVLNKIGEPSVTVAAASANSFAEEELVAAAKSGDEGAFEILSLAKIQSAFEMTNMRRGL
jgi:hypothetical protein